MVRGVGESSAIRLAENAHPSMFHSATPDNWASTGFTHTLTLLQSLSETPMKLITVLAFKRKRWVTQSGSLQWTIAVFCRNDQSQILARFERWKK